MHLELAAALVEKRPKKCLSGSYLVHESSSCVLHETQRRGFFLGQSQLTTKTTTTTTRLIQLLLKGGGKVVFGIKALYTTATLAGIFLGPSTSIFIILEAMNEWRKEASVDGYNPQISSPQRLLAKVQIGQL